MKDVTGKVLELGDYVVYPGRIGSSMRTEMVLARIMAFKLRYRWDWQAKKYVERETATVKQINRAVSKVSPYASNVAIANVYNLTKVDYSG